MGEYNFILDNIKFSYSSVNTYSTCPWCFYLTYIEVNDRESNAFGEYGTLIHHCIEEHFKGNLDKEDMVEYYENHYFEYVNSPWPIIPKGIAEIYYNDGINFFSNFDFDISKYDVLSIEEKIDTTYEGLGITIKPDVLLRNKENGLVTLLDFKTSKMKNNNSDAKKISEYINQLYLYTYFIEKCKKINIDYMCIWFIRNNAFKVIKKDSNAVNNYVQQFRDRIKAIKEEENWVANNTKENQFFCNYLCSMRNICGKY